MMNWRHAARIFRRRWISAEWIAERNIDRFLRTHERCRQLEAALKEIAGCNDGEGYMPELAKKALGQATKK